MEQNRDERNRIDYNCHTCSAREYVQCLLISAVLSGVLAWLFYRSRLGMLLFPAVYVLYLRSYKKTQIKKTKERLLYEFKDAMRLCQQRCLQVIPWKMHGEMWNVNCGGYMESSH